MISDFPITIYLDLNHWINLAKKRKQNNTTIEDRLKQLVDAKKIILPISALHMIEASAISNKSQRNDLFEIFKTLSRGFVLRYLEDVRYLELKMRIGSHYELFNYRDITQSVIVKGFLRAFGEPNIDFSCWREIDFNKSIEAELEFFDLFFSDIPLELILSEHYPKLAKNGNEAKRLSSAHEQTRKNIEGKDLDIIENECILGFSKNFAKLACQVVIDLKLTDETIKANPPKHFWTKEYMSSVPSFNVWSKLNLYLARSINRDMTVNDLYDIGHLSVALPYCRIVVADKAMSHLMTFRKLHDKYDTYVYSSLEKLVKDIENI